MNYTFDKIMRLTQGSLARLRDAKFDASMPVGNLALFNLHEIINLWLVGKYETANVYLPRTLFWLDDAIAHQEALGVNQAFHMQHLYEGRAIAGWMHTGQDDPYLWDQARIFCEAAWRHSARPWTRSEILLDPLNDYMVYGTMGGSPDEIWQDTLEMYESWLGEPTVSLKKTLKLREYCYAMIQNNLSNVPQSDAEFLATGEKILANNLTEKWLDRGQTLRAVAALKLIYVDRNRWIAGANHAPPTPLETVLKTLQYLPK